MSKRKNTLQLNLFKECLEKVTELAQAITNILFNLSATEDVDGPIVTLSATTTRLTRQKHVNTTFF